MRSLLFFCLVANFSLPGIAQTMTNTATTITLTNTCLNADNLPAGSYNLSLQYNNPITGPTGVLNYSGTMTTSGSSMTISVPTASFPTVAADGYWALADVNGGVLTLSNNGVTAGVLYWQFNTFSCTMPSISNLSATPTTVPQGPALKLTWTGTDLSDVAETDEYQSTNGGNSFINVGTQTTVNGGIGVTSSIDLLAGASDLIYVVYTTMEGFTVQSNTIPVTCSTCSFTPPTPQNCTSPEIVGPTCLCNLEANANFVFNATTNYANDVTWSVSPSNLSHSFVYALDGANRLTLIRTNQGPGVVTITGNQSLCTNTWHQTVQLGLPTSAGINVNYTSGSGNYVQATATAETFPGATYAWTLTMSTGGVTHYSGNGISFSLAPCTRGTLSLAVTTQCGIINDGVTVFNSNCGGAFYINPNPSTGFIHLATLSDSTTAAHQPPSLRTMQVVTTAGTVVYNRSFGVGTRQTDVYLPHLAAGLYMVKVTYWEGAGADFRTLLIK